MTHDSKRVAIVDNAIDHRIYRPVEHWRSFIPFEWEAFPAKMGEFPDLNDGYTHLILTGSEASILDRRDWVYKEIELVQGSVDRGLSVLGSCYGHQLLALALAGTSAIRRCPNPEMGWIPIRIDPASEFLGHGEEASTFTLHFDEVTNLNENFEVLAWTEKCPVQVFQLKNRPVWGIQPHPEIGIAAGKKLLRDLGKKNPDFRPEMEKALRMPPKDSGLIHIIIKKFFSSR